MSKPANIRGTTAGPKKVLLNRYTTHFIEVPLTTPNSEPANNLWDDLQAVKAHEEHTLRTPDPKK